MESMAGRKREREGEASEDAQLDVEPKASKTRVRRSRFATDEEETSKPAQVPVPPPIMPPSIIIPDVSMIQSQLAAQLAVVTAKKQQQESEAAAALKQAEAEKKKKAAFRPLLLDSEGREIDEFGQLVRQAGPVKTLAANVAVHDVKRKKANPYLAHRAFVSKQPAASTNSSGFASVLPTAVVNGDLEAEAPPSQEEAPQMIDNRIVTTSRDVRAKKALKFVEEGKYTKEAESLMLKEERRILAGYASGRRAPELVGEASSNSSFNNGNESMMDVDVVTMVVPNPPDDFVVPTIEWWDELYLPKEKRDARKRSKEAAGADDSALLSLSNCKTNKYVQHPVPIKPLGGEKAEVPLPMFLTKKERKRLRKSRRQEREQEKRDKQMMGLIPAPEPKFKLSNFMKILGDQAVADPSKVEQRVLQQVRQRELNHEIRNLTAKLTPAQKKEKKIRKAQEAAATSKQIHVAAFKVADLSNLKHRFKVDVNAQQSYITGLVVLCQEGNVNLVIAEGGPKGIRKFIRLMLERIDWSKKMATNTSAYSSSSSSSSSGYYGLQEGQDAGGEMEEEAEEREDAADEDDDDEHEAEEDRGRSGGSHCVLLWEGVMAKRNYVGFSYKETKSVQAARNLLDQKQQSGLLDLALAPSSS